MSAPKVSVVIPVYNCEKYLQACIDSLLGQTLHALLEAVMDGRIDGFINAYLKHITKN